MSDTDAKLKKLRQHVEAVEREYGPISVPKSQRKPKKRKSWVSEIVERFKKQKKQKKTTWPTGITSEEQFRELMQLKKKQKGK